MKSLEETTITEHGPYHASTVVVQDIDIQNKLALNVLFSMDFPSAIQAILVVDRCFLYNYQVL